MTTPEALEEDSGDTNLKLLCRPSPSPNLSLLPIAQRLACRGQTENRAGLGGGCEPKEGQSPSGRTGAGAPARAFRLPSPIRDAGHGHKAPSRREGATPRAPTPTKAGGGWEPGKRTCPAPSLGHRRHPHGRGERVAEGDEEGRAGSYPHLSAPPAASRHPWLPGVPRSLRLPPRVSGDQNAFSHRLTPSPSLAHTPANQRPGGGGNRRELGKASERASPRE